MTATAGPLTDAEKDELLRLLKRLPPAAQAGTVAMLVWTLEMTVRRDGRRKPAAPARSGRRRK